MNKNILSLLIVYFIIIPLASALEEDFGMLIENPWFVFVSLFAVFFAVIYAILHKSPLGKNIGVVAVIAVVIAFIATAGLFREEFIPGFSVIKLFIIAAVLAIVLFLVTSFAKAAYFNLGIGGVFIIAGVFFSILYWLPNTIENTEYIPYWLMALSDLSLIIGIPLVLIGLAILLFSNRED